MSDQRIADSIFDGSMVRDLAVSWSRDRAIGVVTRDDVKLIVTGPRDTTDMRWDAGTAEEIGKPMEWKSYYISKLALSTDGDSIVLGSSDGSMQQ